MQFFNKFWHQMLGRPYRLHKTIDVGRGPIILLVHGIGTDAHTWDPLIEQIDTSKWRVIGYDLLGFGDSPKPATSTYDVNEHARSLVASLGPLVRRKEMVIIGHSMGCLVASHIAAVYPKLARHLILYEPPLFADSPEFRSHKRRRTFYFAFYQQILKRPQILASYSRLMARFAQGRVLNVKDQEAWLPFERSMKNTIMKQQAYTELKQISLPTDIIYGKFDFVVTRNDVKNMLAANKNITFHLVNEMHDVTKRAAKYIVKLLEPL
jgi:pimeloyl-ACP methyl ester carboxylesterase